MSGSAAAPRASCYAGTFAAIWFAMSTAEFFGSTAHVLASTMTLFFTASARPQAFQPVDGGSCRVEIVLRTPLALDIAATGPPRPGLDVGVFVAPAATAGPRR